MRLLRLLSIVASLCTSASYALAQAPANNTFANAEIIEDTFGFTSGTNENATKQGSEPNHAGNVGGRSVWYRWTAPSDGYVIFDTSGSSFDTLLGVYTGTSVSALTVVGSNDDADPGNDTTSRVAFPCTQNVVYRIAVDGKSAATGDISLSWNLSTGGVFSFTATSFLGSEGLGKVVFTVQRRFGSEGTAQVDFATEDGTAIDGDDYNSNFGSVLFEDGETIQTFEVEVLDDDQDEPQEQFTVTLTSAGGAGLDGTNLTATGVISDDDTPPTNDSFSTAQLLTGSGVATLGRTTLATQQGGEPASQNPATGKTVWYRFVAPANGVLVFTLEAPASFNLELYRGTTLPALVLVASNPIAPTNVLTVPGVSAQVTNGNTYYLRVDGYNGQSGDFILRHYFGSAGAFEIAATLQADTSWKAGRLDEDFPGTPLTVTINRVPPPAGTAPAVSVAYEIIDQTTTVEDDYVAAGGTLNFAAGELSKTFNLTVTDDFDVEGEETLLVRLKNPGANAVLGIPSDAVVSISDNEDDPTNDLFADAVELTGTSDQAFGTVDGADREPGEPGADPETVWYKVKPTISGFASFKTTILLDDTLVLPSAVYTGANVSNLTLVPPASGQNPGAAGQSTIVPLTANTTYYIQVNRNGNEETSFQINYALTSGGFVQFDTSTVALTVDETAGAVELKLKRINGSAGSASVTLSTSDVSTAAGLDYTPPLFPVTFASGETEKTVSIPISNDILPEGDEVFTVTLTNPSASVLIGSPSVSTITIVDNDDDPANDEIDNATAITDLSGTSNGTTEGADTEAPLEGGHNSVWYAWTAPQSGTVTFTLNTVDLPAELKGFTRPNPPALVALTGTTTGNATKQVKLTFAATSGVTYYLAVAQENDDDFALSWLLVGPSVFQFSSSTYTVSESVGTATVTVTRTGATATSASVAYKVEPGTAGPSDFDPATGTLTFAPNQTSRSLDVFIKQDLIFELPETILLSLSTIQPGDALGTPSTSVITITSDDSFAAGQGTYSGLISPTSGLVRRGTFTMLATSAGSASGRVVLDGHSYSWTGSFNANGQLTATIRRKPPLPSLTLTLQLDDGIDRITGTITDGTFVSSISGDRATFALNANETPLAGAYTVVLSPENATAAQPQGYGYAVLSLSKAGRANVAGTLADGTRFSTGAQMAKNGRVPIYALLYRNLGSIAGELTFKSTPGVSDASGTLQWSKPVRNTDQRFKPAFVIDLPVIASRYEAVPGQPLFAGWTASEGDSLASFNDGNLPPAGINDVPFKVDRFNHVIVPPPNTFKLSMVLLSARGVFRGIFTPTGEKVPRAFNGVLFQQGDGHGYGLFFGPTQSGTVDLEPAP